MFKVKGYWTLFFCSNAISKWPRPVSKMPSGRTKFCNAWLSTIDANSQRLSTWCRKGADDFHAYCRFCVSEVCVTTLESHICYNMLRKPSMCKESSPFLIARKASCLHKGNLKHLPMIPALILWQGLADSYQSSITGPLPCIQRLYGWPKFHRVITASDP